ncbi:sulfotransferase [Rubrobacter xylanophilus DSM 9941]|uniref:Sulfotransferase n=1 Tax=Rubrobacter xylanophilus (strain DSM 9941 / JCM 11954 / NBRC 16129 / PRD-1) TaxID=266117 RepID=Q1ARG7_RUBXD|nr:sulfotransferase [Rubrobacter xylanophilus]ABG06011.1 sulfotransferase [Rubrobacter xylanophilus DSM 9941]
MARIRERLSGLRLYLSGRRELRARIAEKDERLRRLRARLDRMERGGAGGVVPAFFLLGRARSGTTWLRSILNAHPEILCWGEGRFFEKSFLREDHGRWQVPNIVPVSLYGAILRSELLRSWVERSVWSAGSGVEEHLNALTRLAISHFLGTQLAGTGARIAGDKTPFVSAEVFGEIAAVYPEAKVIHIIRDGRDVAVSLLHHMWNNPLSEGGVYDLSDEELRLRDAYRSGRLRPPEGSLFTGERLRRIAADWSREVGRATEDGPSLLGENYAEVRYEDLLARPEEETERLLRFLGVDAGEEAVRRCVESSGFERSAGRRRGEEDATSRLRKGIAGDWRNVFTPEDRRIFKEAAGELLIRLGYERDAGW